LRGPERALRAQKSAPLFTVLTVKLGFRGQNWPTGLLAPAGAPKAIINQITQATHVALTDREYQQTLIESGLEPDLDSSPEKFRRSLEGDIARWTPIVNAIGLKLD
jgi:tripartite-type tricarboxylate transporter receptor subunit TctC